MVEEAEGAFRKGEDVDHVSIVRQKSRVKSYKKQLFSKIGGNEKCRAW